MPLFLFVTYYTRFRVVLAGENVYSYICKGRKPKRKKKTKGKKMNTTWKTEEVTAKQLAYGDRLLAGVDDKFRAEWAEFIERWEDEDVTRGEASEFISALRDWWEMD